MKDPLLLVRRLPVPFNFYRLVVEGDHLHFGYWPEDQPQLSLEEAQKRMFERLMEHFPAPPAAVLDVGCGLGLSAGLLAEKGYRVTAIAPSEELIAYAAAKYAAGGADFQVAGFLDPGQPRFASSQYDVLLFQESLQYLRPLAQVFQRARDLLKPKGTIILADEILLDQGILAETAVHALADVISGLLENGFRITVEEEMGGRVRRTCDNVVQRFSGQFDRLVAEVGQAGAGDLLGHFLEGWRNQKAWYESGRMGYQLLKAKKDTVFMRGYRVGDEHGILSMFNEVFKQNRTLDHWYWKFRDNPFGNRLISEAVTEDGTLAAHYCGYPVPFHSKWKEPGEFVALHIGDTMTHPRFRTLGLGTTSVLKRVTSHFYSRLCRSGFPFNYGFNTGNIRKFGQRFLQYEPISEIRYLVRDLKPPRSTTPGLFRKLISGLRVERVLQVTEEYDRFFAEVAGDYGLLVKRSARYLKWRYLDCPDRVHELYALRRRRELLGWGVFLPRGEVLLWGDALFRKQHAKTVEILLSVVASRFHADKSRIETWCSPVPAWWLETLTNSGFEKTREPNRLAPAFKIFDRSFSSEFFERRFYYTMGDSDLF